jgi:signal transduction histidine kinase
MRERVRFVDGKIAIRSELSNGTRIDVQNSASFESACP